MNLIGDRCFITEIQPGSDAEKKLHRGDQVVSLGKFSINRKELWQLEYYLNKLAPMPATDFILRDAAGIERKETVLTKFQTGARFNDPCHDVESQSVEIVSGENKTQSAPVKDRYVETGDVLIWKMQAMTDDADSLSAMFERARKHKALILDLRGNLGSPEESVARLAGGLFDHDVTIGKRLMRKGEKALIAKSEGKGAFSGRLIVLIDSRSASAAEVLARVVQIEHRGTVVGDQSAGSVVESTYHTYREGPVPDVTLSANDSGTLASEPPGGQLTNIGTTFTYGAYITSAELIKSDGRTLEQMGVTPDVEALPTAADLAEGRDPMLAKAAELAGITLDPAAAGKMFPFEQRTSDPENLSCSWW